MCACVVRAGNDEELKEGLSCTVFTFQTITDHFRREALLVNDFSGKQKKGGSSQDNFEEVQIYG